MDIVPKSGALRITIKVKKVYLKKLKIYLNRGVIERNKNLEVII